MAGLRPGTSPPPVRIAIVPLPIGAGRYCRLAVVSASGYVRDAPMRRILLADADAFYVAVARALDPEGAGRAALLIVGGSRESRGVVCSASYETRKFGVRSAMPIARALRLCPDAMCVPVPMKACGQKSAEIRKLLHRFAPVVAGAAGNPGPRHR